MIAVRRLVAILVADVDGYSRLIGEDEAETAKAVSERLEVARPIVSELQRTHRQDDGRRRNAGVSFHCSSGRMRDRDPEADGRAQRRDAGDKRIVYRIGVNLGDVLIEGDDILGDGVNIAARLEGIARAACCSQVRHTIMCAAKSMRILSISAKRT